ncbi:AAA family ATPase [Fusibacter sp. 3D3]|uniref:ATP-binding protein n=1 Tax=Fusibacter sp. 3D3 TaxID=1048380 RepID=UPI000852ABC6|nr:AAA family ATPase [Fusibacter sp. 3D3]GAU77183.1 DNA double-strand break repair Rad50 ATPase [Fusibacter sp. 3D3]
MIIKKIHYKAYGKLKNQVVCLNEGLNLIYGENETGKSTIFNSLLTLLYGISPQSKERHPYVNWDTNDLDFSVWFETEAESYLINRRLMSSPKTTLTNLSRNLIETSRNDALKMTSGVSESLYASVFHFTSDHLSNLEDETWESIQENLIFNYGMDYLRKTSDILAELEGEINRIWRRDKRGNPLINQKQAEIRALMKQRVELDARYNEISKLNTQIEDYVDKIQRATLQKKEIEREYKAVQSLIPIKEKIEKIQFLKTQLINYEWYKVIDENAYNLCTMLKKDVIEFDDEILALENEKKQLEKSEIVLTEESLAILENGDHVHYAKSQLIKLEQLEGQLQILTTELSKKSDLIHYQFQMMFDLPYELNFEARLIKLNPLEIKTELYKYMEISKRPILQTHDKKRLMDYLLIVIGVGLLIFAFALPSLRMLGFLGTTLLGFTLNRFMTNRNVSGTVHEFEHIKVYLTSLFEPMPLPEYVWQDVSLGFVSKLEQLLALIFERTQIELHIKALKKEVGQIEAELKDALSFVVLDHVPNIKLSVHMISLKLDKLMEKAKQQELIRHELNELNKQLESIATKRRSKNDRLSELEMNFLNLGQGNLEQGFKNYHDNNELIKRIKIFEEELTFSEKLVKAYEQFESKTLISTLYLEEIDKTISELVCEIQEASIEQNNLIKDISILKEKTQMDEIESQLLLLQEEVEELIEKRNQLMVLDEVVKFADEKFRRENQPDILQSVSDYMRRITNGKYQEVLISEQEGKFELQFLMDSDIYPISRAFSKGTIHQLFLAFRLAVIDSLNEGPDKLPLVLDEVFINWDDQRMKATRRIIEEMAKERQVILLTCHKHQLTHFEKVNIIRLEESLLKTVN